MTLMSFGRALSIHMMMLSLVGYEDTGMDMEPAKNLESRISAMKSGLAALIQYTGEDLGYDVMFWREFLIEYDDDDEYGYTHPYAFRYVDEAVLAALEDPEVVKTLQFLSSENN